MKPSGSAPPYAWPGRRLCQFGVSSRSESQRSVRHELATSPRSITTWAIERCVRKCDDGEPCVPRPDDHRGRADGAPGRAQLTSTVTFVGFVIASNTADRFCDWATRPWISSGLASASIS